MPQSSMHVVCLPVPRLLGIWRAGIFRAEYAADLLVQTPRWPYKVLTMERPGYLNPAARPYLDRPWELSGSTASNRFLLAVNWTRGGYERYERGFASSCRFEAPIEASVRKSNIVP